MTKENITKMDNKTLRKGFTTFAEQFKNDVQLLALLDENGEKSSEDIITMFINDLSTEKVLEYVNTHMEIVPVLQINVNGEDVTNLAIMTEQNVGHDIEYIRKLNYGKPMCKIGEDVLSYGMDHVEYSTHICSYLTIDGEWIYVIKKEIAEITDAVCEPCYLCSHLVETNNEVYFGIDYIMHLLDEKYQEFFEK